MWNTSEINFICEIFFHIRMWGLGLSLYLMLNTILYMVVIHSLICCVWLVQTNSKQIRQIQTNRTKSLIHPSLTYPPWRHVVQINRLRYSLLPAQTSSECLPQCSVCFGFSQLWHLGGISLLCSLLRVSISISAPVALRTRWRRRLRMGKPCRMRGKRLTRSYIAGLTNCRSLNQGVSWSKWTASVSTMP